MSQIITTPDGVEHEFPDTASDDVIKNTLSSYSKGTTSAPASPTPSSGLLPSNPVFNVGMAPKDAPLGQTAFWNKPADASWGQYIGAHLQPIDDMVRHATNVGGIGDRFAAYMDQATGQGPTVGNLTKQIIAGQPTDNLSMERAQSAAADARMPIQNRLAADYIGTAPVAALGLGMRAADAAVPYIKPVLGRAAPYVARAFGNTAEGAVTGGGTAYGRGEDVKTGTMLGSLWGLGSSLLGGRGPSEPPPTAPERSVLEANKASALNDLSQPKFNPADADEAYRKSVLDLTGPQRANVSYGMKQAIIRDRAEIARGGPVGGDSINGYARNPFDAARTNGDNVLAAKIRDNLVGENGVLANATPLTNHAPGEALDLHNAFQTATARLNDHDWLTNANINTAPAQAAARLKPDSGMLYDKAGTDALGRLAALQPKSSQPTGILSGAWQGIKDFATGAATDRTLGAGLGWVFGGIPGIGADIAAQGTGAAIKGASKAAKAGSVQRAIDAAKVATTTGRPTLPSDMLPQTPLLDAYERAVRTGAASGR